MRTMSDKGDQSVFVIWVDIWMIGRTVLGDTLSNAIGKSNVSQLSFQELQFFFLEVVFL